MKRWTDSELEILYYNKKKTSKVIHRDHLPNRSICAIIHKKYAMSLRKNIMWKKEQFMREDAKEFYERGLNDKQITDRLLITRSILRTFKKRYGFVNKNYLWKKEEEEILKEGLKNKLTYRQIAEHLPLRTRAGVSDKVKRVRRNAQ